MNLFDLGPVATGLIGGVLFGIALEGAGFASPCKLVGQLRFRDWTVFNVMFTAIIVAAGGLYILELFGVLTASALWIPTTFFWATLAGGAFVGLGMGVGGYCPGTSIVGFCSGRMDAIFFFVGLILGPLIFAGLYDWMLPMLKSAQGPTAQTVPQLIGLPTWLILAAMVAMLVGVGVVGRHLRQKDGTVQNDALSSGPAPASRSTPAPSAQPGAAIQARVTTHGPHSTHTHS